MRAWVQATGKVPLIIQIIPDVGLKVNKNTPPCPFFVFLSDDKSTESLVVRRT